MVKFKDDGYELTREDRVRLRELAKQVSRIAALPKQQKKAQLLLRHNDLEHTRPVVLVFPEGSWVELIADPPQTSTPFARDIEMNLLRRIYYEEHLPDDNVIDATIYSPTVTTYTTGWGISGKSVKPDMEKGASHVIPVIHTEADVDSIQLPQVSVDWEQTNRVYAMLQELFRDLLTVQQPGYFQGVISPLDKYAQWRGIDALMCDLIEKPAMVHKAIGRLVDGQIGIMRTLEAEGALALGNRNHYAGSGGTSYTAQLPRDGFDGQRVRTMDLWGFATAQVFSEVSPAMHEEFALQHEKRFLELFGLNSYGCCEPLHLKLESLFEHVPRLRRISISPWADVEMSAEKLQDAYIFSWKPNPADLAGPTFDPDRIRQKITNFCDKTRGCIVEMIMKDTHTVRNEPSRMHSWVKIAKEVALQYG